MKYLEGKKGRTKKTKRQMFPKSPFKDDKTRAPDVFGGSKNESLIFAFT